MSAAASRQLITFGPLEFDAASGLLYRGQQEILLPMRVGKVLEILLQRPGEVFSKDELLAEVWKDAFVGEDSLTQAISMVRSALGDDPRDPTYIQTIPKRGYRFIAEVGVAAGADPAPPSSEEVADSPHAAEVVAFPPSESLPAEGARADSRVSVGSSLGHYEIVSRLGAGAMGVVYRARDTVLEREVALKVLPEDFLSDPDRVARFEREAKLLAAVSHPNIAAIHSLEEEAGTKFPVLELVEGETLGQRLRAGPIKVEGALEIARQIASALEAAHERGIIHRDLKPANIKITPAGQVKVLDFGLAKALEVKVFGVGEPGAGVSESPTESMTIMGSRRGSIVGTAAYMSPEQARGQEAGKQADIWAFGCVLYEMLTGKRAFAGDTVSDTIAKLLERTPDWTELPAETPRAARRLVRRCLSKDPRDRLHNIADARIEVEAAIAPDSTAYPEPLQDVAGAPIWRRALPWGVAAVALAVAAWVWLAESPAPSAPAPLAHLDISFPPDFVLFGMPVFAPDGSSVYFAGTIPGQRRMVYERRLDGTDAVAVRGTEGSEGHFLSPDGTELGFWIGVNLHILSLAGGAPRLVYEGPNMQFGMNGFVWGEDGTIFAGFGSYGVRRISSLDGAERNNIPLDPSLGAMAAFPETLPGGKAILYSMWQGQLREDESPIVVHELAPGSQPRVLIPQGTVPKYAPTGHIVYARRGALWAVPFDVERLEVTGNSVPVLDGVYVNGLMGTSGFDFSDSGSLVYEPSDSAIEQRRLVLVDHAGNQEEVTTRRTEFLLPSFSPNGDRLAVADTYGDIWIFELRTGNGVRLASEGVNMNPIWTPDGSAVIYSSNRDGPQQNLYQQPADGSAPARRLTFSDHTQWSIDFSPDGRVLAIEELVPDTASDILMLHLGEEIRSEPFVASPDDDQNPKFSPDGRWVVYRTMNRIYVKPFPGPGAATLIATGGQPLWSPDGREIYYMTNDDLMVVEVELGETVRVSEPTKLFTGNYRGGWAPNFDISPDGGRFLMIDSPPRQRPDKLHVILNWFEELKQLVPAGR